MSRLAIRLLGSPFIELDDRPVHISRRKAVALLAYLAITARSHSRESLVAFFWPETDAGLARAELRRTLSVLSRALGSRWFAVDRQTAGLNPDLAACTQVEDALWLDVQAFRTYLSAPATHDHGPDQHCETCLSCLEGAVALYRDDLLAGFTLRDSAPFDEWQSFETQALRDELAGALDRLAGAYHERGAYERAISHARRRLALDPLHEAGHRQLMQLYAASGQRAAALCQYHECRRVLLEELGVPPQEATVLAYEAIQREPERGARGTLRVMRGYELQEPIGQGGFGVVYRGYQPDADRRVAIKVMAPQHANRPDFVQRFEREAQLVARLEHPHIVPLYDYWREADGAYLVMRWLRGGNLRESLRGGPWQPNAASRLLDQIAGALALAHRQGIVHRDVKPENILLDEEGNAYLSDFGIAKDLLDPLAITKEGELLGSPAYTSPEQIRGKELSPQSDIYSLGVVMYETLTAEHPFPGATLTEQILYHLQEPLPALCERRADLPRALEVVIQRATAKEPGQRYAEALSFAKAFREALSGTAGRTSEPPVMHAQLGLPSARGATEQKEPPHNLPLQPYAFVGRARELDALERLLDPSSASRLVTVIGLGGVGKTRLALHVAQRLLGQYPDGAYLVALAPLQSVDAIVPAIAHALGFAFSAEAGNGQGSASSGRTSRRQLLDYLQGKRMLLLIDNWEHLLDGVGVAVDILQTAPGVKIVATSRAKLSVQGEQLFHVEGMGVPAPDEAGAQVIVEADAVRLFVQGARRVRPEFELAAADIAHVADICRLVEGMPLAVLLAAAWIDVLAPAEIAHELECEFGRGLDLLESDLRDLPERQRSIRALFDHSWNLLTDLERTVLAGVSVFRGSFTRAAAQEIAGASLRELRSLVSKSLLHRVGEDRYEMHALLRQYAAERLAGTADGDTRLRSVASHGADIRGADARDTAVRDRHCAYYAAALERWAVDLKSERQQCALAEMDAEIDNARAAWGWAAERGAVGQLDRAMEGLGLFYEWRHRTSEGKAAFEQAAHGLSVVLSGAATSSANARRVLARALSWQGMFSETERNRQLQEQSLALLAYPELDPSSTRPERALALLCLSDALMHQDRGRATQLLEESLALYRAAGDRWGAAEVLNDLGWAVFQVRGAEGAQPLIEESLAIYRSLGDPRGIARSLCLWGAVEGMRGNLDEAIRLYKEVLVTAREMGDQALVIQMLLFVGVTLMFAGRYDEAGQRLEEALPLCDRLGRSPAHLRTVLGWVELHQGHYERARIETERAWVIHRCENDLLGIGNSLAARGAMSLAQGKLELACQDLREGVSLLRQIGQYRELYRALTTLGQVEEQLGNTKRARQCFGEALRLIQASGMSLFSAHALPRIAVFLLGQREDERAVELYACALRDPYVAHSRWFEETAEQAIAAAAARLPPDRVAAAQERGRTLDLQIVTEELLSELQDGPSVG